MSTDETTTDKDSVAFTRRSIASIVADPVPTDYVVLVTRYWPRHYDVSKTDDVFDAWDQKLAPSAELLHEYDDARPWDEWADAFIAEVGRDRIRRRAARHHENATRLNRNRVTFACFEPDSDFPECHTFSLLDVLDAPRQVTLADWAGDTDSAADDPAEAVERPCVEDTEWCPGPDGDDLPCWECYQVRCADSAASADDA